MNLIKRPDLYFSIIKIASVARFLRIMRREGNLYESDTYFAIIVKKPSKLLPMACCKGLPNCSGLDIKMSFKTA